MPHYASLVPINPVVREKGVDQSDFENPVPSGLAQTALDPAFRDSPSGILDELRSREPVHKDRMWDRVVLTRASDVNSVLNDRTLSSDPCKSRPSSFSRVT